MRPLAVLRGDRMSFIPKKLYGCFSREKNGRNNWGGCKVGFVCLFIYLIEQVDHSQLLANVDLLYFHRRQLQHQVLHALFFSNSISVL